mmetsp:Transcript_65720/g.182974  ORF Transcript_65720/g.182974 Transcript_65720/m.182974 type:complete len:288 (+) Transcript_65720:1453-2316(+)
MGSRDLQDLLKRRRADLVALQLVACADTRKQGVDEEVCAHDRDNGLQDAAQRASVGFPVGGFRIKIQRLALADLALADVRVAKGVPIALDRPIDVQPIAPGLPIAEAGLPHTMARPLHVALGAAGPFLRVFGSAHVDLRSAHAHLSPPDVWIRLRPAENGAIALNVARHRAQIGPLAAVPEPDEAVARASSVHVAILATIPRLGVLAGTLVLLPHVWRVHVRRRLLLRRPRNCLQLFGAHDVGPGGSEGVAAGSRIQLLRPLLAEPRPRAMWPPPRLAGLRGKVLRS